MQYNKGLNDLINALDQYAKDGQLRLRFKLKGSYCYLNIDNYQTSLVEIDWFGKTNNLASSYTIKYDIGYFGCTMIKVFTLTPKLKQAIYNYVSGSPALLNEIKKQCSKK